MKIFQLFTDFNILDDYCFIAVVSIIVLLLIAVIVLFAKLAALSDKVGKQKGSNHTQHKTMGESERMTDLAIRVQALEKKLEAQINAKPVPVNTPATTFVPVETEKPYEFDLTLPDKPKMTEFYMSTPNPDGSFEASQISDVFRPTVSLYKFTSDPKNPSTASFEFFSDESGIKDALNNPKTYIKPVCYEENDAFPGAKKIIQLKKGTAKKMGDKWVVDRDNRLRIKYQ